MSARYRGGNGSGWQLFKLAAALAAMAALLICVVVYAQRPALVYPDPSEGVACSLAFDSLAEQIGSPHRTCIPKETTK